jgi:hypothetical protein
MARGTDFSAYEAITVAGTAVGLTAATILGKETAIITVETAQVRVTLDGTTPTSTVGHILEVGDVLEIDSSEGLTKASFIRTGGTSGTLRCSYGD